MTQRSTLGTSTINATLRLNYDPLKAVSDITTKVNAIINQYPRLPIVISVAVGEHHRRHN